MAAVKYFIPPKAEPRAKLHNVAPLFAARCEKQNTIFQLMLRRTVTYNFTQTCLTARQGCKDY
jgi:hypothetical protein